MDDIKFDAILYVAAKRAGRPELDMYYNTHYDYVPSKRFMRRMRRFINRVMRKEAWDEWKSVTTPLKRIAIAAMLVCTISLAGVLSIKAVRDAIWSTIVQWYDKYIEVMFVTEDDVEVPTEILEYKEPRAGLDGYERYEVDRGVSMYTIEYEKENSLITYSQLLLGIAPVWVSNEETTMYETLVCGSPAMYFNSNTIIGTITTLMWHDDYYQYSLEGLISLEELITIAESVH